jgi:hypothetical protein
MYFIPQKTKTSLFWFISLMVLIITVGSVEATQYYVSIRGNDDWSGMTENGTILPKECAVDDDISDCVDGPWRTIQHAVNRTGAGDVVNVMAGTYNEFVVIKNSGLPDKQRIIQGERGADGEWLTIIDPGKPVKNWMPAPEVGPGVCKVSHDSIGFEFEEMTVDGRRIGRIRDEMMVDGSGRRLLATPPTATIEMPGTGLRINYWDGIEALAANADKTSYVRFRNGESPIEKQIKAYPYKHIVCLYDEASYNTIRNVEIIGGEHGVILSRGAHHNLVEHNAIKCNRVRVGLYFGAHSNTIRFNHLTMGYYGHDDFGAWTGGKDRRYAIREHIYRQFKYTFGHDTSHDTAVRMIHAGNANVIHANRMANGLIGITASAAADRLTQDTVFSNNVISNMSSTGFTSSPGLDGTQFFGNTILDCNISIRWHEVNESPESKRTIFMWNNRCWQHQDVGRHIHIHWLKDNGDISPATFWLYHNSFCGGAHGIYNSRYSQRQRIPGGYIINNIFSVKNAFHNQHETRSLTDPAIGAFDYNWVGPTRSAMDIISIGRNNRASQAAMWPDDSPPNFSIPPQYAENMKSMGLDISKSFTLKGVVHDPLPGSASQDYRNRMARIGAFSPASHQQ